MSYLSNASEIARELSNFRGGRTAGCLNSIRWDDGVGTRLKNRVSEIVDREFSAAMAKGSAVRYVDTSQIEKAILAAESHLQSV